MRALPALEDDRVPVSRGSGEKSSIVPLPPSASIPRRHACVAASEVDELVRVDEDAVPGHVVRGRRSLVDPRHELGQVQRRRERGPASDLITARFSRTSGNSAIGPPNASRSCAKRRRLEIGAAHQPGRAERVQPARRVEHDAGGDPEAVLERADRDRRARRRTRSRRSRAPASRACPSAWRIVKPFGSPSTSAGRGSSRCRASPPGRPRPRRDDELVGVRDRAEPLLAVSRQASPSGTASTRFAPTSEPPCASVRNCAPRWQRS